MSNKCVALVTGGSRGIGKSIVMDLARSGIEVYFNYSKDSASAMEVVTECSKLGFKVHSLKFSVEKEDEVVSAISQIKSSSGKLDILVNNAGITKNALLLRTKLEDWDQTHDVNLKGAFLCSKAALKLILKSERGRIINISSVVAEMGNPGQAAYVASKAGMIGLTKSLALELGAKGITVNAITPGFIDTDMTAYMDEEQRAKYLSGIPLGRFGSPEDVASLVTFLSSESACYMTGQVIGVNGGLYM